MHLQPPAAQEVRGHEACTAKKVCGQPCPGHMGPFPRNEEEKVREHAPGKRCYCSLRIPQLWSALCKMVCNCPCLVQCQSFEFSLFISWILSNSCQTCTHANSLQYVEAFKTVCGFRNIDYTLVLKSILAKFKSNLACTCSSNLPNFS